MKKSRGITLITLIITIAIIILLAGTTTYISDKIIKSVKVENVKTNMLLIQAQIKTIAEKHNFDAENNKLIGEQVTLSDSEAAMYGVETAKEYYKLSSEDLVNMKLDSIETEGGYYYVCYETEEIIYTLGVKNSKGNTLYTLTQIKGNDL